MSRVIGTLGTIDNIEIGGRQMTQVLPNAVPSGSQIIELVGTAISSANNYATLRAVNGTSGYQVTSGKTFYVLAVRMHAQNGSTAVGMNIGYGNNDVGQNTATIPTSAVFYGGDANMMAVSIDSSLGQSDGVCSFTIPATKYIFMAKLVNTAAVAIQLWGYEA